jgi:diphthamide synthase subunit DPH2
MKITICGSIAFFEKMQEAKKKLEERKHEVDIPPTEIKDGEGNLISVKKYYELRKAENNENTKWIWERKKEAIKDHFEKIVWGDVILVLNYEKNGIMGYIGANTLMEMGLALHLNKPIYILYPVPEISYKEELLGMQLICLNGDLNLIK